MHVYDLFILRKYIFMYISERLACTIIANLIDESLELISVDQPDAGARIPDLRCLLTVPSPGKHIVSRSEVSWDLK